MELVCLSRTEGELTNESLSFCTIFVISRDQYYFVETLRISTILQVGFQGRAAKKSTDGLSSKRTTWKGELDAAIFLEEVIRSNARL